MEPYDIEHSLGALENKTKYTIIEIENEEDGEVKRILDEALYELTKLYNEFRIWVFNHKNTKEINDQFSKLKQDSVIILARTKDKIAAFQAREDVQAKKAKAMDGILKLIYFVHDELDEVTQNEQVMKVLNSISTTIDSVLQDERVIANKKKIKNGTLKVAKSTFYGVKRVLDTIDK